MSMNCKVASCCFLGRFKKLAAETRHGKSSLQLTAVVVFNQFLINNCTCSFQEVVNLDGSQRSNESATHARPFLSHFASVIEVNMEEVASSHAGSL